MKGRLMNSDTQLYIDGQWRTGRGGQAPVLNPANEETIGSLALADKADLDDALAAAERGFEKWRRTSAFERSKLMRRAAELLRERNESVARAHDDGAGKATCRSATRGGGRRRCDRLVRGRRPARLRPRHPRAGRQRCAVGGQGAGRPGRRLLALEFPDQSGGAQDFRRAGGGVLDHPQGPGGYARQLRRAGRRVCRRWHTGRRAQPGVRRPSGDQRVSHPASDDPENLLHRVDRRRQTARVAGGSPHETGDDGARRPRAGDRIRRRRCRSRRQGSGHVEIPQRRPDLRRADALHRARERLSQIRRSLRHGREVDQGRRWARRRRNDGAIGPRAAAWRRWRR